MNNTVKRSISGIGFIGMMLLGLLVNKFLFAILIMFIMGAMLAEFYRMTMGQQYRFSRVLSIFAGEVLFLLFFLHCAYGLPLEYVVLGFLPLFVVMSNSLYVKDKDEFWKFSFIYTGILYISIPLALSNLIVFSHQVFNGLPMLCFFLIIWGSDVGAYIFGISLGQKYGKKLFPSVSPKKSWVGFWGGMLCAILTAWALKYFGLIEYPTLHCVILAMVMHVAGVYGDLFESQWKRCYDLKDSGNIIPGHGGMLDRFDSTLFAIPAGVLYLVAFNLI